MDDIIIDEPNDKYLFIKVLIILFIIGIFIGAFIYYKNSNVVKTKDIVVELGSELSYDVTDYLSKGKNNAKNCKLYLDDVDTNTVGTYTYKIKFRKHTKKGRIKVVDTVKPEVELDEITMSPNDTIDADLLLLSCKDLSLPCKATFKDENIINKLKKVGTYQVDVIVSDFYGNKVSKTATINVKNDVKLSSKKSSDLIYFSNSENDDKIEHILFVSFDEAIEEDSSQFKETYNDVAETDFEAYVSESTSSAKILVAYNKYGYAIGLQVLITYPDGRTTLLENR